MFELAGVDQLLSELGRSVERAITGESPCPVERALRVAVVMRPKLAADVVLLETGSDGIEVVVAGPAARDRAVRGVTIELARRGRRGRRLIHVDVRRRR